MLNFIPISVILSAAAGEAERSGLTHGPAGYVRLRRVSPCSAQNDSWVSPRLKKEYLIANKIKNSGG